MKRPRIHLGLPVLVKELTEQANRRRTYVLRTVYALLLFGICGFSFYVRMSRVGPGAELLGYGRQMFEFLFWFQLYAIYVLLPAMLCGSVTGEKERNTLSLLLLTNLGPWEILFQKLLSRLMVVFSFLLLTLPLLGIAYALGGVDTRMLAASGYALVLTCLQVGAATLACSAFCRTAGAAFVMTGLLLSTVYMVPFFLGLNPRMVEEYFTLPYLVVNYSPPTVAGQLTGSFGVWLSIAAFLLFARWSLTARANVQPRSLLLALFRLLDGMFKWLNDRLCAGRLVMQDRVSLPDERPVAWRERTRRALGKPLYLVRLIVVTEVPVAFICLGLLISDRFGGIHRGQVESLSVVVFIFWPIAAAVLAMQASGAFSAERNGQTLTPLLATPMPTGQIVREKVRALQPLITVLIAPLLTAVATETWLEFRLSHVDDTPRTLLYIAFSAFTLLVYPPLVIWISLGIGMRMRTPSRAAITSLTVVAALCLAPVPAGYLIDLWVRDLLGPAGDVFVTMAAAISPVEMVVLNESRPSGVETLGLFFIACLVHGVLFGFLLGIVRSRFLRRADAWVGRVAGPAERITPQEAWLLHHRRVSET